MFGKGESTWILLRKSACQSNMKLIFNEVTYIVDYLKVKALMMIPKSKKDIKRIVIYLRGGKGQVGRVRAARLMQFANEHTLVIGPYYRGNNGSEGRDEFYRGDLNDVTHLIRL